jgi:hypothetical protein
MRCLVPALLLLVSACGGNTGGSDRAVDATVASARLEQIAGEVDAWASSSTLEEARAHAEAAANLVVGPGGLGYGDRDGNGTTDGAVERGLLPGPDGTPAGVVLDTLGDDDCVRGDVLGGSWDHPRARWSLLADAIAEWAPENNTFPLLPSHPMRIVGWSTLAQSATFAEAIEYSGHADIHVDVTRDALSRC